MVADCLLNIRDILPLLYIYAAFTLTSHELTSTEEEFQMKIQIQREPKYLSTIPVGGGAMTKTITGTFVITEEGRLPNPVFVKKSGPLSCAHDQAIVPIKMGDLIIEVTGPTPAQATNPDLRWIAKRVIDIKGEEAEVEPAELDLKQVPASVWEGLSRYHNRDGRYFTGREFQVTPDKIITLYDDRKLIIRAPRKDDFFWTFLIDEPGHRNSKEEPFELNSVVANRTPEEVAKAPRYYLYSLISSSWIDENWQRRIEPQIIAFVKEVCG